MDIQRIKELALANGFKLKEQASGNMDLNAYVYDFANAIEREVKAQAVPEGFVLVLKDTLNKALNPNDYDEAVCSANELLAVIEAQQPFSTLGCFNEP